MSVKSNYDYSISLIRFIATIFIIVCHILQYWNNELAWWFNVGVQIFLCMSGYLYGKRGKIENDVKFICKNSIKILVDYYVVIIPVLILFFAVIPEQLSPITAVKVLLTNDTLSGGGHLWYIPYCLFCYLITPFLSRYFEKSERVVTRFIILSMFAVVIIEAFFSYFNSAWVFCYMLGFFLGNISDDKNKTLFGNMSILIVTAAVLLNSVQIVLDYILGIEFGGAIASIYLRFCNFAHVFLGVSLFIVLKFVFSRIFAKGYPDFLQKLCSYSDKYSYDIYLVHQFVILGPFSLMAVTGSVFLNLVIILAIAVVGAVIVNLISSRIKNKIEAVTHI